MSDFHPNGTPIFDYPPCYNRELSRCYIGSEICLSCHYLQAVGDPLCSEYFCLCFQLELGITRNIMWRIGPREKYYNWKTKEVVDAAATETQSTERSEG